MAATLAVIQAVFCLGHIYERMKEDIVPRVGCVRRQACGDGRQVNILHCEELSLSYTVCICPSLWGQINVIL